MSRLEHLQRDFAYGVIGLGAAAIAPALNPSRLGATGGLGIYRNHFLITLEDALAATFQTVRALVGADFFGHIARRFVQASPPESPCLFEYGETFPGFLDDLPEARELPYLGDAARLEWAVNIAHHAADLPTLSYERVEALVRSGHGGCAFALHPAVQLVSSCYPLTAIWRAAQPDSDPALRVDLDRGGENVLVLRVSDEVVFRVVSEAEFRFLRALAEGCTLARAMEEAMIAMSRLERLLVALLESGAFIDVVGLRDAKQGVAS